MVLLDSQVTNEDLFNRSVDDADDLYVVTKAPDSTPNGLEIRIAFGEEAAVIDKHRRQYPAQKRTISAIRSGRCEGWLLSGGAIIFDQKGRIAVGMRDGNAADPFAYTNIAAGRCDRKLADHCYEELSSEFILCINKGKDDWRQINLGESTALLERVRKQLPTIKQWKSHVPDVQLDNGIVHLRTRHDLPNTSTVSVFWQKGSACQYEEHLLGFLFVDAQNHTVEFRLPVEVDLSKYCATEIFFAEGTGFATWMFPQQICELCNQTRFDGSRVVTPFLAWISSKLI